MPRWAGMAATAGSCLVLGLCFVDFRLWPLAWVALAPLVAATEAAGPRAAFRQGFVGGVLGLALAFSWLVHAFQVFGGFAVLPALLLFAAPIAWMALQLGVFASLVAWLGPLPYGVASPLTFVGVEFLFPSLFPWRIAHTQYRVPVLLQSGEIAGPWILGFVIVWVNAALATLVRERRWRPLAAAAAAVVLLVVLGGVRRDTIEAQRRAATPLRVGVIQGNISVEHKGDRASFHRNLDEYRRLSTAVAPDVDLLVWPETVAQHPIAGAAGELVPDADPFPDAPRPLIFGGLGLDEDATGRRLYNSAFLRDTRGAIAGRYDKRILVPFGEYLPFEAQLPWLRTVSPASGRFSAGGEARLLAPLAGVELGPLICYEDVIPGPARAAVRRGATVLVNLTNDAWYGDGAEPLQHQALATWRAVETRRDLIRSTNTGFTAAIAATGEVLGEVATFEPATLLVDARPLTTPTFYARYGDVVPWLGVVVWLGVALRRWARSPPGARARD